MRETDAPFARSALLIGAEGLAKLDAARVAVFGLGGVGGWAAEALARAGVGALDLCDGDVVSESNLNRQLVALYSTRGMKKTEAAAARLRDIRPSLRLTLFPCFFSPETADAFDFSAYDYVLDAVDQVSAKLELIRRARAAGVPILSAMGAGNRLDPTRFRVAELEETSVCPLARTMRALCRRAGLSHVRVVFSDEPPARAHVDGDGRHAPGSMVFAPAAEGLVMAAEAVRTLLDS